MDTCKKIKGDRDNYMINNLARTQSACTLRVLFYQHKWSHDCYSAIVKGYCVVRCSVFPIRS